MYPFYITYVILCYNILCYSLARANGFSTAFARVQLMVVPKKQWAGPPIMHNNHKFFYCNFQKRAIPGPPFVFGACLVTLSIFVLRFLPSKPTTKFFRQASTGSSSSATSQRHRQLLSVGCSNSSIIDSTKNSKPSSPPTTLVQSMIVPPLARRYRAGPIIDVYDEAICDDDDGDSSTRLLLSHTYSSVTSHSQNDRRTSNDGIVDKRILMNEWHQKWLNLKLIKCKPSWRYFYYVYIYI